VSESKFDRNAVLNLSSALGEPAWMREFRLAALEIYESLPMPTIEDEAWRRTDIRSLRLDEIGPALNGGGRLPGAASLPTLNQTLAGTLVEVDGVALRSEVDEDVTASGVILTDMHTAVRRHGELVRDRFMTQIVRPADGKFAALHAAFWRGGTFLYVPAGVSVDAPFHSLVWGTAGKTFSHTLAILAPGASATLVTEYVSRTGNGQALHNGVIELLVQDGARLRFAAVQNWGRDVWQLTHERALVGRDAELDWVVASLGSRLTKSFQTVELDGQGASARMSGLFFADGNQHLDHDTQQNHNRPDTTSDLLYKGALKEKGRSVWQGMIKVLPGAQRANGYQANRNLILEKSARADSIPGLEIEADDVRCTHGATVGQLDPEEIFYLMSRGLPRIEAERLVVSGFFAPLMDRIPVDRLRERLAAAIQERVS
jgi:Fe-S cluster assembly protein SufD